MNLPGHPVGSGYTSIKDYADFMTDYIERNDVKNPVIIGHSMGGAIAIELALRDTNMAGLVLVGTGARLKVHSGTLRAILEDYGKACELVAKWSVSERAPEYISKQIAEQMLKVPAEVVQGDFSACDHFDVMNDVDGISAKTLVVCGADDRLTPVKYSQYLHERIRGSKLVIIPDAGHSVMLEKYRGFNAALEDFLASL